MASGITSDLIPWVIHEQFFAEAGFIVLLGRVTAIRSWWVMSSGIHMNARLESFPRRPLHCNEMTNVVHLNGQPF